MLANDFPIKLYSSQQVRQLDRCAIDEHGIDGFELMQKAARFALHSLLKRWPDTRELLVLCGSGNNGGDGYVMAALAAQKQIRSTIFYVSSPSKLAGDAALAYALSQQQGVVCREFLPDSLNEYLAVHADCVIVDALLGTGLNAPVRNVFAQAIQSCNVAHSKGHRVFAVDLPSGLSADTGQPLGLAIEADATATFIGMKLGLLTGSGPAYCGQLYFDALDVPDAVLHTTPCTATRLHLPELLRALPRRRPDSHKGDMGHILLLGGNHGFGGAIMMAAEAAARCGSGLTSIGTRQEYCAAMLIRQPEVMAHAITQRSHILSLLDKATALVVGPGLGQDAWAQLLLATALERKIPTVLDADALNLLVQHPQWLPNQREHLIYTPHPGEAARMLETDTKSIQKDRLAAVKALQQQWGGSVVLKGAGSLIVHPDHAVHLCPYGNPGMASGGMGDVLSGVLGGLLAQGLNARQAVNLGVSLHSAAADQVAKASGERGLLATDLIPVIRAMLNPMTE